MCLFPTASNACAKKCRNHWKNWLDSNSVQLNYCLCLICYQRWFPLIGLILTVKSLQPVSYMHPCNAASNWQLSIFFAFWLRPITNNKYHTNWNWATGFDLSIWFALINDLNWFELKFRMNWFEFQIKCKSLALPNLVKLHLSVTNHNHEWHTQELQWIMGKPYSRMLSLLRKLGATSFFLKQVWC